MRRMTACAHDPEPYPFLVSLAIAADVQTVVTTCLLIGGLVLTWRYHLHGAKLSSALFALLPLLGFIFNTFYYGQIDDFCFMQLPVRLFPNVLQARCCQP
eukprot:comp20071_c0_seq2/m.24697 comp20071_c0_seq2/g.24697  ORF comp20071_c0_seq2/g.24697 comp20071_c0_seq2/m.24697 type:complete len:100 (-) comp20071_c0_seq2:268-567(-)